MYEICKHVNFMFQFGIIIDYLFTFQKILFFFSKYPVLGYLPKPQVNTQKIFTYPLGIYPPHITNHAWFISLDINGSYSFHSYAWDGKVWYYEALFLKWGLKPDIGNFCVTIFHFNEKYLLFYANFWSQSFW